jgi:hypothetical protein
MGRYFAVEKFGGPQRLKPHSLHGVLSGTTGSRTLPGRGSVGILAFGWGRGGHRGLKPRSFWGWVVRLEVVPFPDVIASAFWLSAGGAAGLGGWRRGLFMVCSVVRLEAVPFPFVAIGAFGLRVDVDRRTVNGCLWHGPFRGIPYVGTIGENRTGKGTTFSRTGIRLE